MGNKICLPMHERTSVRMLAEYDMSHFRFGVQGISNLLILILGIYVNWEWSKKGIRKLLLHNCIAGLGVDVIFFKVLRSPVMFSINRRLRFIFFRRSLVRFLLMAKAESLQKEIS